MKKRKVLKVLCIGAALYCLYKYVQLQEDGYDVLSDDPDNAALSKTDLKKAIEEDINSKK